MSRIRSIKPEFWTSEQILECSPIARLMFIGMWNFADDCGRMPCSPKSIKAQVFPADDLSLDTVRALINELSANGLILIYSVEGKEYLEITGWSHQRIDKPQPAKYPAPFAEDSGNAPRMLPPDRIGEDRKGKDIAPVAPAPEPKPEKKSRKKPQLPIADDFAFGSRVRAYAAGLNFSEGEIARELERFKRHAKQNDRRCADWQMAAENWFDKAAEFAGKSPKVVQLTPAEIDWNIVCADFKRFGRWSKWAGSEPGSTGCRCPPEILQKHGILSDPEQAAELSRHIAAGFGPSTQ